jgi:hypothetical protein
MLGLHKTENMTAAQAVNALEEIGEQIKKLYQTDDERKAERKKVTSKLVALFKDDEFDFGQARNLEFEMEALLSWPEYREFLEQDAKINTYLLYKYSLSLVKLHDADPGFVESAELADKRGHVTGVRPKNLPAGSLFEKLNSGYLSHFNLLGKAEGDLRQAFCRYYRATKNPKLAHALLDYNLPPGDDCGGGH